jgi:prepilin-type N-terminal cleavage/methylation domain-containing protein
MIARAPHPRRAFTLAELLVAMGVIAVVASVTVISVKGISQDARLASGKNAVTAALASARGRAIASNRITAVVFRPQFDGLEQRVEIVIAEWNGDTTWVDVTGEGTKLLDRFVPVADVPARRLPKGIKVAAPDYAFDNAAGDFTWVVQSHLPAINQVTGLGEIAGRMVGVLFGPDGTTILRNPDSNATRAFVDFNVDRLQNVGGSEVSYPTTLSSSQWFESFFDQVFEEDETFFTIAPFLSVYDDDEARDRRTTDWTNAQDVYDELTGPNTGYISLEADRLHFNRYTGVVMR